MKKKLKLLLILFCSYTLNFGQNSLTVKDITVLDEPAANMMRAYLTNIVDRQFAVRDSLLSTLKSAGDWKMRALARKDSMISWTGHFL